MDREKIEPVKKVSRDHLIKPDTYTIIIGEGRFAGQLAASMDSSYVIISRDTTQTGEHVIYGDGQNADTLRKAGIRKADTVAVVTDDDKYNEEVGVMIRDKYHIPNIVIISDKKLSGITSISLKRTTNRLIKTVKLG